MLVRFLIIIKICRLSSRIKSLESLILKYRYDAHIKNQVYYCGSGDVDTWVNNMCDAFYFKIAACQRLLDRYEKRLDGLDGVVGQDSSGKN